MFYFNIGDAQFSKSRSQFLRKKKLFRKLSQTLTKKSLLESLLNRFQPRSCNCIKITSSAQEIFYDFCEVSIRDSFQNIFQNLYLM